MVPSTMEVLKKLKIELLYNIEIVLHFIMIYRFCGGFFFNIN